MVCLGVTSIWDWGEILMWLCLWFGHEFCCLVVMVYFCNKADALMKGTFGLVGLTVVKEFVCHQPVPFEFFCYETWNEVSESGMFWFSKYGEQRRQ